MFVSLSERTRFRLGLLLVSHVTVWSFWKTHNDLIYFNKVMDVEQLLDRVHLYSWKWFFGRHFGVTLIFTRGLQNLLLGPIEVYEVHFV